MQEERTRLEDQVSLERSHQSLCGCISGFFGRASFAAIGRAVLWSVDAVVVEEPGSVLLPLLSPLQYSYTSTYSQSVNCKRLAGWLDKLGFLKL